MSDLSPELRQLFRAAGHASRPTGVDRERVLNGLEARLGVSASVGAGTAGPTVVRSAGRTLAGKTAAVTVAALAIVAGGVALMPALANRSVPEVVSSPHDSVVVRLAQSTKGESIASTPKTPLPLAREVPPALPDAPPKSTSTVGVPRRPTRAHDSLAEEAAILSRAQSELHGGRAASSLKVLAEYERKFGRGILAQEGRAVRIQALCALGRVSEANALLGGLPPQSLTGESARQSCSSSKNVAPRR